MFKLGQHKIYNHCGTQTELRNFRPAEMGTNDGKEGTATAASWSLIMQFLGTPELVRLTSMPTHQFLDVYFP